MIPKLEMCAKKNIFGNLFSQHGEKTVLVWMFCSARKKRREKGMDFFSKKRPVQHFSAIIYTWAGAEQTGEETVSSDLTELHLLLSCCAAGQTVFEPPGGPCLFRRNPKVCKYSFYSLYRSVLSALFGKSANRKKSRTVRYYFICYVSFSFSQTFLSTMQTWYLLSW